MLFYLHIREKNGSIKVPPIELSLFCGSNSDNEALEKIVAALRVFVCVYVSVRSKFSRGCHSKEIDLADFLGK